MQINFYNLLWSYLPRLPIFLAMISESCGNTFPPSGQQIWLLLFSHNYSSYSIYHYSVENVHLILLQ